MRAKTSPPRCLFCSTRPATPDLSRMRVWMGPARRSEQKTRRDLEQRRLGNSAATPMPTKEKPKEFMEQRLRQSPRRFCDECRMEGIALREIAELPLAPQCSDDELFMLVLALIVGLDPVTVLWRAVQAEQRRLKRMGQELPNVSLRVLREMKRDARAMDVVQRARTETAAQEARRTGKKPGAIRGRRLRARRRLGLK